MTVTPESISLWGGTLALDFANTVDWTADEEHAAPAHSDVLSSPAWLVRWGARLGVVAEGVPPAVDDGELARVRELRDALHRSFAAIARQTTPRDSDLQTTSTSYAEAVAAGWLTAGQAAWRWEWPASDPRRVRFAFAIDAVKLLQDTYRLTRLTRCPGRNCGWLFINTSGRRRWCSMTTCGSRDKMRRMYQRQRPPTP